MGAAWLSLLWTVLCVAAIAGLAYWFTRHVVGGRFAAGALRKDSRLEVVSTICLGREQQAAVVRAGTRLFLLGITPHEIRLLSELQPEEFPEEDKKTEPRSFREALTESIEKKFRR